MTESYSDPDLHFLWLEVSQLDASASFYRGPLGLPVQEPHDNLAIVHLGNTKLYLAPGLPRGGNVYIAIAVPDIDAMYQRLLEYELAVAAPIDEGWARYINVIDPDGYRILLLTPTTSSATASP